MIIRKVGRQAFGFAILWVVDDGQVTAPVARGQGVDDTRRAIGMTEVFEGNVCGVHGVVLRGVFSSYSSMLLLYFDISYQ